MRDPSIIDACHDSALFDPWFKNPTTWAAWFAFLKTLFGLLLTQKELALYRQCTGRTASPPRWFPEAWIIVGRRGGKSFIVALVAVYLACFRDYSKYLARGERGTVMINACDRKQARVIFRYVRALLEGVPMLARLIERVDSKSIDLTNGISIEIHTASFRAVRGYTIVAAINDEIAFWRSDESANPDREILDAQRPAMATIPGALLLCIGSAYAQRGVQWEAFRDHHARDESTVLVWRADTRTMNPTVPQRFIDDAYARDPVSAAAEYGAQFRTDVSAFLNSDWLDRAVQEGRHELPPQLYAPYHAFADPSGGGSDAFTLGIAHREQDGLLVLDVLRARRPPFSPESVVVDYAAILKCYGLHSVTGDKYAAQWVIEAFAKHGIAYRHSERNKSEIYLEAEPLFAQGSVRLPDDRALLTELRQLERRTARGGRDTVDHPPRGHDDLANAAAGALWLAAKSAGVTGPIITVPSTVPSMVGGGDLEHLTEQRRTDRAVNTGGEERQTDWLNDFW